MEKSTAKKIDATEEIKKKISALINVSILTV
jgi:hypothetical protein